MSGASTISAQRHRVSRCRDGAVDTHAHVIGLPPDYPFMADRSYTPPEATARAYLAMLDATGATYGVLTQVSVHGTDNRLLAETLRANRQRLRGIAVIPLDCPERERAALKEAGVVGLRINVLYGGGRGIRTGRKLRSRCAAKWVGICNSLSMRAICRRSPPVYRNCLFHS